MAIRVSSSLNGRVRPRRDSSPLARVGVIGCGYWGPQVIRNLRDMPEVLLVGVAEPRRDRHALIHQLAPGVRVYSDHRALLDAPIDAVVIATPIETHYAIACEALRAGRHVLVEKPLTANVDEAVDLVILAGSLNRILMVGHTFVYNPAVAELRRLVQMGELGNIYHVDAARLNLGLFQRHVNVIWDLAPHDISILMHVLDRLPVNVSARGSACVQPDVHDVAYLELLFPDGVAAQVHVSWLEPSKVRRVTVVGDSKMAVFNDVAAVEKVRIYDVGVELPGDGVPAYRHGEVRSPYIPWTEPLRRQCEHFAHCVATQERPLSDGVQGLTVVAVLEAANRSLAAGGVRVPVSVPRLPVSAGEPAAAVPELLEPLALPAAAG